MIKLCWIDPCWQTLLCSVNEQPDLRTTSLSVYVIVQPKFPWIIPTQFKGPGNSGISTSFTSTLTV